MITINTDLAYLILKLDVSFPVKLQLQDITYRDELRARVNRMSHGGKASG